MQARRARRSTNYWPGFVDALSTLVMVVIFVLLVFMVAQFFLSSALSGRDAALARLTQQINELSNLLALEKSTNEDLRVSLAQLSADLQSANQAKDDLSGQLAALLDSKAELEALLAAAEQKLVVNEKELVEAYGTIEADKETIEAQLAELALLQSLKQQLDAALAAANAAATDKDAEIARLQAELAATAQKLVETQTALAAAQLALEASQQDLASNDAALSAAQDELSETEKALAAAQAALAASRIEAAENAQALTAAQDLAMETENALAESFEELAALRAALAQALAKLATAEALLETLRRNAESGQQALAEQEALSAESQRQVELLNAQLAALRLQLARLATALEASEAENLEQEVEIANLGARLNEALASKVQELARYRSEFFGRLREILGERQDIRIVGDRFVFQSEVLFASGQAVLGAEGELQIAALAETLQEIIPQIPPEIDWVLQVNGHTDRRPVINSPYASNWELSQARALSVVRALMDAGIPPERLVAAGYAEFQPLDPADTDEAYALNRRIEIKLTER